MRPVMHGDVVAAARVLYTLPMVYRRHAMADMVLQANAADQFRHQTGRYHPLWGNGSLMSVALAKSPPPEPKLSDREYCACLALVFETLAAQPDWTLPSRVRN